ncbi:hypothetical protein LPJ71_009881 [Coemansia sp. S17]|nr:hypothetical protein LPJ71_009881 [Coemansia sp. S17]
MDADKVGWGGTVDDVLSRIVEVAVVAEDVCVLDVCGADDVADVVVGHAVGRVVVGEEVVDEKVELV